MAGVLDNQCKAVPLFVELSSLLSGVLDISMHSHTSIFGLETRGVKLVSVEEATVGDIPSVEFAAFG